MNEKERQIFLKYRLPLYLWMAIIFLLSSLPKTTLYQLPHDIDKIAHMIEYCILGVLLVRSFLHSRLNLNTARFISLTFIIGALYAGMDEINQSFVPGRDMDIGDWIFDCLGVALGIVLRKEIWRR